MSVAGTKLGASQSLVSGEWTWPVHGMRHPPEGDTSGWYWWSGEWSDAADFFLPLHAAHLMERCPQVAEYLEAPPGTRVLLAQGHADVWTDEALLDI